MIHFFRRKQPVAAAAAERTRLERAVEAETREIGQLFLKANRADQRGDHAAAAQLRAEKERHFHTRAHLSSQLHKQTERVRALRRVIRSSRGAHLDPAR